MWEKTALAYQTEAGFINAREFRVNLYLYL